MDPGKLAVVGHDFGGMTGLLAAAADGRPRCHVLLALTPRFEHWMFYDPKKRPTDEQDYRRKLATLDPIDALTAVAGPILVQMAKEDFYVPPDQIRGLAGGAPWQGRAPHVRDESRHGGVSGRGRSRGVPPEDAGHPAVTTA